MQLRRSPLCDTCGDLHIKKTSTKIMVFIFLILCIGIIGFFYLFDLIENMRITILIIIFSLLGISIFGYILIGLVTNQEK